MNRARAGMFTCLLWILCISLQGSPLPAPQADHASEVDALFAPWAHTGTPGAGVLVIQDGRIVLEKGYGLANLESGSPIEPNTAFLLASVSKQFTAMAIMILAERGRLSYDDPLSRFFPGFPPYADKITVRHLLNHTSGLQDYEQLFVKTGKISADWPRSIKGPPDNCEPSAADALRLLEEQTELRFQPGAKWEYSNSGYMVLGQIVEKASGQRYRDFLRDTIFHPLGMTETAVYDETKPKIPNRAASYRQASSKFANIDYTPLNGIYGEDNVVSTLNDMYKWDQALYTDTLVRQSTLAQAFRPGRLNDNSATDYGFGWSIGDRLGLHYVEHGGGWLGFRTFVLRYPQHRFSVIVLSNLAQFDPGAMANKVARVYLRNRMTLPIARHVAPEILRKYAGKYEFGPGAAAEVTIEGGQLWIRLPRGQRQKLLAESETRFFVEGEEYVQVEFNRDAGGHVVSLMMPESHRTAPKAK
jgi:CubicO group peptidase (beta-lactamase class C family)